MVVSHKLDYLLRCLGPNIMEELAAEFDHRMLETFFTKVKIIDYINDQDQAVINKITHQSNASLSLGGFGLSSAYDKLSTSFISSLASAVRTDTTLNAFDHYSATSTPISGSALSDRVNTALQSFHGIVKQHKLPKTQQVNILQHLEKDGQLMVMAVLVKLLQNN